MAGPNSARQGSIRVHIVHPGVVESVYFGYLTASLVEDTYHEFTALLRRSPSTHWIADASSLSGFDPKCATAATVWLEAFRDQGGQLILMVTTSASVRMVMTTVAFAARLPVKMVATHAEAMGHLPRR